VKEAERRGLPNIRTTVEALKSFKDKESVDLFEKYNSYRFPDVVAKLEEFIVVDLSRKYIQMIRDRSDEVHGILNGIRDGLLKLLAPIVPFYCERVWLELGNKESIHLTEFPKFNSKKVDLKLEGEMNKVFEIIEKGLNARDEAKIGLKWPLMTAYVKGVDVRAGLLEIVKSQLNVKNVDLKSGGKVVEVKLNTEMSPSLEAEGYAREISRKIQALRKKAGFVKSDCVNLYLDLGSLDLGEQLDFIKERVNAVSLVLGDGGRFNEVVGDKGFKEVVEIRGRKIGFGFEKV